MSTFQAVIIGGDLGAYALARELNDAYGVRPVVVTSYDPLPTRDSSILVRHVVEGADDEGLLVSGLMALGRRMRSTSPGTPILLLANTDWRIRTIARHVEELGSLFTFAIPPLATIDEVGDKAAFARIAEAAGMPVPATQVVDLSGAGAPDWRPPALDAGMSLPVVAKPATSAAYETLEFPGRKKVYMLSTQQELDDLWTALATAGFRDRFLVQELIPGDDTAMRSVTCYMDGRGRMTMGVTARVLLEEHAPATLGNPCAMVTERDDALLDAAERFLRSVDYRGFANFDVKVDPRTGTPYFFEVNPRIGRNSFYCVGAGSNPMTHLIEDLLGDGLEPVRPEGVRLYSIVPNRLLLRYLVDPALKSRVRELIRGHRVVDPLDNPRDLSPRRRAYRLIGRANHVRKFREHYPHPTQSGF